VLHQGKHDLPSQQHQQLQQQGPCAAAGVYGRLCSLTGSTGLGGTCLKQYRGASATSAITTAFRASDIAAPATPATSVSDSAFYFQDGGGYRTTPVAGAPMASYYEKCAI